MRTTVDPRDNNKRKETSIRLGRVTFMELTSLPIFL